MDFTGLIRFVQTVYLIKDGIKLQGNPLVHVAFAEIPFAEGADFDDVLEECMHLQPLGGVHVQAVL